MRPFSLVVINILLSLSSSAAFGYQVNQTPEPSPEVKRSDLVANQDESDATGKTSTSQEAQAKLDQELAAEAMQALRNAPPKAVRLATERLESTVPLSQPIEARLSWIAGVGNCYIGDFQAALELLKTSEAMARSQQDVGLLRRSLRYLAAACLELGRFEEGAAAAKEGVELSKAMQDKSGYPALLHNELAGNLSRLQDYSGAITHYEKAIDIARQHKNAGLALMAQHNLADVLADFGRSEEAAQEYQSVLEMAKKSGNDFLLAAASSSLATIQQEQGKIDLASTNFQDALKLAQKNGWRDCEAISLQGLGEIACEAGDVSSGLANIEKARAIYAEIGDASAELSARETIQLYKNKHTNLETHIAELEQLLEQAKSAPDKRLRIDLTRKLAIAHEEARHFSDALTYVRQAEELEAAVRQAEDEGVLQRIRMLAGENQQLKNTVAENELKHQLETLSSQNELKESKLTASRRLTYALASGFLILLLGSTILWFGYRSRTRLAGELQKASELLEQESQKNIELERRNSQTERMESLSLLSAGIAHDFNNLLTAISVSADFGQLVEEADKKDQMLAQIIEVSQQAAGLTKQLVQFMGTGESGSTSVPAKQLQSTAQMLKTLCHQAGSTLETDVQCPTDCVATSDVRFQQILVNVVTNAIEASPNGSSIRVSLEKQQLDAQQIDRLLVDSNALPGDFVCLRVADEGHGIPDDVQSRIFDPYFSTRKKGRGLGLSSVMGITLACNGAIDVRRRDPSGTEFLVFLPIVEDGTSVAIRDHEAQPVARESTPIGCRHKILLVDDEELALQTTAALLSANGFDVVSATGAKAALDILKENKTELGCVVTDLTMPQFSGEWLARQIQLQTPEIPVILYSGCIDPEIDFAEANIVSFVQKPFKLEELQELLHTTIANRFGKVGTCKFPR